MIAGQPGRPLTVDGRPGGFTGPFQGIGGPAGVRPYGARRPARHQPAQSFPDHRLLVF